jgi:hypothetical protein
MLDKAIWLTPYEEQDTDSSVHPTVIHSAIPFAINDQQGLPERDHRIFSSEGSSFLEVGLQYAAPSDEQQYCMEDSFSILRRFLELAWMVTSRRPDGGHGLRPCSASHRLMKQTKQRTKKQTTLCLSVPWTSSGRSYWLAVWKFALSFSLVTRPLPHFRPCSTCATPPSGLPSLSYRRQGFNQLDMPPTQVR